MTATVLTPPHTAAADLTANTPEIRSSDETDIYEAIFTAIVEQRLVPGTRLIEEQLGEVFGVSRARIRKVLANLAHTGIIRLERNRGAFVARPSQEEARQVFEARQVVEQAIIRSIASDHGSGATRALHRHVKAEAEARQRGDRRATIRLSGEFHLLLAGIQGNAMLTEFLRTLVSRSSLIIAVYPPSIETACSHDEHAALIAAVEAGNSDQAVAEMSRHLEAVFEQLNLGGAPGTPLDLHQIFAGLVPRGRPTR
ncbi:MAG: GntR family transcriptional regulator [Azospirillaceae bacterium]|nr:GntR family transcriptional regulator [Azospirillaceae bacterium]